MKNSSKVVGGAIAEWNDDVPLLWTMTETIGKGISAETKQISIDLNSLIKCYDRTFLLAIKEWCIESRLQVRLSTIQTDVFRIQAILQACQNQFIQSCGEQAIATPVFEKIDSDLILGLWAIHVSLPANYLTTFRTFYNKQRYNSLLFHADLRPNDFPKGRWTGDDSGELGAVGKFRKNVLASALNRAMLVQILNVTEAAYEAGELSLDLFAYSRLLLSRAARPESFRLLRLKDLRIDEVDGKKNYFLSISIPKSRTNNRPIADIRLHEDVGMILNRQRDAVAKRLANLIQMRNSTLSDATRKSFSYTIGDLPLFPGGGSSGRMTQATKDRLGMLDRSLCLTTYYVRPLVKLTGVKMNHIAMRHTLGTQLAIAGCAASTIAAVLLHASTRSAAAYVDIIFSGAIDQLSDSMEPAFLEHFPVIKQFVSVADAIAPSKRIVSLSAEHTRREVTGECGREQICHYAPIACYECPRFKPCYDVDHSINLERVTEEVEFARSGGLARQVDAKRYIHIANRIRVVINICEAKREALAAELAAKETAL